MSFQTGNLPSSGSAPQPADHSEHRTAQQPAHGLSTGWGNGHEYHSAQQPGQHSHHSSAEPPAGELCMAWGVSLKWTTCPSKWSDSSQIFATHCHAAPRMQAFATTRILLREIPWRRILEHLLTTAATRMNISFDAPKLLSAVVEAAGMSTLENLASYLHDWRAVSERVQAVLDWQISPQEMCERNRPGAWLADCMITELKVREQGSRSSVHYEAVGNGEYKIIAHKIGIAQECATNSSPNNVGNQLECLCWVAFEEDRPEWIIALVWHALQLELTWCSRKKLKSSAAVTAATEADELSPIRSDLHPAHETQAATWEERVHIPAHWDTWDTELEAGHFHEASRAASQASEVACGMVYEANVSPAGAVPKTKAGSMGQSSEESAAPAPPPKAKLPDSAWLMIAKDPWRAQGIALPWHEDYPQRPPPRAEPSAPSSSSTAKRSAPDAATPRFLKPKPKTKSMQTGDSIFRARLEDHPQRPPPRAEPSAPSSSSTAKRPAPDAATPPFLKPKPKTKSMQIGDSTFRAPVIPRGTPVIPQEAGALKAAGIPNTPPVGEPESSTARTAEANFAPSMQLECCSKLPDAELDESEWEDTKLATINSARSISRSAQAAPQAAPPSASSATVIMPRESNSDAHPVESTSTTPLWDAFLEILQSVSDEENRRDFANFIQHHCFREDHFFKDSRGQTVDKKIPLSVKMESLFQTAWHRRKLALERLRRNGVTINDETYELNDNDMKTLPQLRLPG